MHRSLSLLPFLVVTIVGCGGATSEPSGGSSSPSTPGESTPPNGSNGGKTGAYVAWLPNGAGCSNVVVYGRTQAGNEYFVIEADRQRLGLAKAGDSVTVDLAKDSQGVSVRVDFFTTAPMEAPYCTDIQPPRASQSKLATRGLVTFTLTSEIATSGDYTIDVAWRDLFIQATGDGGNESVPPSPFTNVHAGWSPG